MNELLERHSKNPLEYQGCRFSISRLDPGPPIIISTLGVNQRRFIVDNISQRCTKEDVIKYIEGHTHCRVMSVSYSPKPGVVVLELNRKTSKGMCLWIIFMA